MENEKIQQECIYRLEILKKQGLLTDLNIVQMFKDGMLCVSEANLLFGNIAGIIFPISNRSKYRNVIENDLSYLYSGISTPYFVMAQNTSYGLIMSVLCVSNDENEWLYERKCLEEQKPFAIVYNLDEEIDDIGMIEYKIMTGGPVRIA